MAKRKRLNRRLVVIIASVTVVVLGVAAMAGYRYRDVLFPKDPYKYEKLGDQARERGDLREAERCYGISANYSKGDVRLIYKIAAFQYDWYNDAVGLSRTERRQRFGSARAWLHKALLEDPKHPESLRLLCELEWQLRNWAEFIKRAEKLVALEPDNHEMHFQLGFARTRMAMVDYGTYADPAEESLRRAIELKRDEPAYWIELARFYHQVRKNAQKADEIFDEALKANPTSAAARVAYADSVRFRDKDKTLRLIREAIEVDPDKPMGRMALAEYLMQQREPDELPETRAKRLDEAIEQLQAAKKVASDDWRVYGMLASGYVQKKEPEKAASAIREGLKVLEGRLKGEATTRPALEQSLENSQGSLILLLAETLLDMAEAGQGQKEQILAEARECRDRLDVLTEKLGTNSGHVARVSGRIAYLAGEPDEARRFLESAYEKLKTSDPKTATALIGLYTDQNLHGLAERIVDDFMRIPANRDNPLLLAYKAQYEMRRLNFEEARKLLRRARQLDPDEEKVKALSERLHIQGGLADANRMWLENEQWEAIRMLEQLHQKRPDSILVIRRLLVMYVVLDRQDKAKTLLEKAMGDRPDDETLKDLQRIIEAPGEEKIEARMAMIDREVADPLLRSLEKASVCRLIRNPELELTHLQEAAKLAPDDPRVNEGLFQYATTHKNWELAGQLVEKARRQNLDGAQGDLYAARVFLAQEKLPEAVAALNEAIRREPKLRMARALLGECHIRDKQYAKAEEIFRQLADEDPSYVAAVVGMAQLTELLGKTDEHPTWVERAYRLAPYHPYVRDAHLLLAEDHSDPEKIINSRKQTFESNPANLRNSLHLGRLYEQTRQFRQAETVYRTISTIDPALARSLLVGLYVKVGRLAEADSLLKNAVADARTSEQEVAARLEYGEFLARHDPVGAGQQFDEAVRLAPQAPEPRRAKTRFLASRRQWSQAAEAQEQYMRLAPEDPFAERQLVAYLVEAGQADRALPRLERILKDDPDDVVALTLEGILERQRGNLEAAEGLFSRAIQISPGYHLALLHRSALYMMQAEVSRAEADLRKAREAAGTPGLGVQLAGFLAATGDATEAEAIYLDVLSKQQDYAPAMEGLVRLYLRTENWERLFKHLAEAKSVFPRNPMYRLLEGVAWTARGEKGKATDAFAEAVKLDASSAGTLRPYWQSLVDADQYEKALQVSDGYENRPDYAAWVRPIRARALAKTGKVDQADAMFALAVKDISDPEQLGWILRQVEKTYGPEQAMNKCAAWVDQYHRGEVGFHVVLAAYDTQNDRYAKAEKRLRDALELAKDPQQQRLVRATLGTVYYQTGRAQQAEQEFLAALAIDAEDMQAANNLAYLYIEDYDQPRKALPYAKRAVRLAPQSPLVLDTCGWALAKMGEYGDAEKYLRLSIRIDKTNPATVYHLAWVCQRNGRKREAEQLYQRVLELKTDQNSKSDAKTFQRAEAALEQLRAR